MRGVLLLSVLSVKSSYIREIEVPLEGALDVPDTLQWWFGEAGCWRIRTYALDHDIHVYQVAASPKTTLEFAKHNNRKHYGDIISREVSLDFNDCLDPTEQAQKLKLVGLAPRIEIDLDHAKFAFWKPDAAAYYAQSTPKQIPLQ
jgi:hypothetical protein